MQPDNFRGDWYGWLTNQSGHKYLGMVAAITACAAWLTVFGEFPNRLATWTTILFFYVVVVELIAQGWNKGDTVEDSIFVVGYGSGSILYTVREVNVGTGDFIGNIWDAMPFVGLAAFHFLVGVAIRMNQARKSTQTKKSKRLRCLLSKNT